MTPFDRSGSLLSVDGRFGFLAFHGGSLERMTDVVATEAADASGASLYAVLQPDEPLRMGQRIGTIAPGAGAR